MEAAQPAPLPIAKPHESTRQRPQALRALFHAADAEVFDFEVVLDAVLRSLAAEAGFLDAAERRDLGRDEAGVGADDAVLETLGDLEQTRDIAGIEVARQPELGIVGAGKRL